MSLASPHIQFHDIGVDGRNLITSFSDYNERSKSAVVVYWDQAISWPGGQLQVRNNSALNAVGSGFLLHEDAVGAAKAGLRVLTAQHVVWKQRSPDAAGNALNGDVKLLTEYRYGAVCTFGNMATQSTCHPISNIKKSTRFDPATGRPVEWDLAVLYLNSAITVAQGMHLSDRRPDSINGLDVHTAGYPDARPPNQCTENLECQGVAPRWNGKYLTTQASFVKAAGSALVKTDLEGASGQSGSGIFYCPNAPCDPTDAGTAVGLLTHLESPHCDPQNENCSADDPDFNEGWAGGPSIPGHRTWILGHT
ncbi:MAG: trypsin-like peptidase domain-containing protein [Alphaproteobacteria bacterium]|nr:trypsin-like peptidase domain-containing protein [Alphaproteobacteria bacterium]